MVYTESYGTLIPSASNQRGVGSRGRRRRKKKRQRRRRRRRKRWREVTGGEPGQGDNIFSPESSISVVKIEVFSFSLVQSLLSCVVISGTEKGRERKREKREDREDGEWKVISLTEEKRKKGERKEEGEGRKYKEKRDGEDGRES